jgi:hypothetical protein
VKSSLACGIGSLFQQAAYFTGPWPVKSPLTSPGSVSAFYFQLLSGDFCFLLSTFSFYLVISAFCFPNFSFS